MRSDAATVDAYLAELPPERRAELEPVLALVRANLPPGYAEVMRWGMITWEVPLEASGKTYNGQPLMYAALGAQKRHIGLYLCGVGYRPGGADRLRDAFAAAGKRLDMGRACVRFRKAEDLALEPIAAAIASVPLDAYLDLARRR